MKVDCPNCLGHGFVDVFWCTACHGGGKIDNQTACVCGRPATREFAGQMICGRDACEKFISTPKTTYYGPQQRKKWNQDTYQFEDDPMPEYLKNAKTAWVRDAFGRLVKTVW